jgi:hypothetical protein
VFPVKYELGFYIPEDDILHSHRHGIQSSYMGVVRLKIRVILTSHQSHVSGQFLLWTVLLPRNKRGYTPDRMSGWVAKPVLTTGRSQIYCYWESKCDPSVIQPAASDHTDCAAPSSNITKTTQSSKI